MEQNTTNIIAKLGVFYLPKLLRVQQYEKYGTTPLQVLTVLQVQVRGSIIS